MAKKDKPEKRSFIRRADWILSGTAFTASFIIYILTLAPTVTLEDSGEFVAGAATLGILHPPGFPTYAMLGKLFTLLPVSNIAFRVNLMSAFFSAAAAGLIFLGTRLLTGNRPAALAAALLAAFSKTHWSQSVVAEVYSLNSFFVTITLFFVLLWAQRRKEKYLFWFSFFCGLGLTNHSIMFLMGPPYLIYILLCDWQIVKRPKLILGMFAAFLLGLLPYLYLPIRSSMNPAVDWGNTENLKNFLYHVTRSGLKEIEFGEGITLMTRVKYGIDFLKRLSFEFTPFLAWLGVPGIIWLWKKRRKELLLTALMFAGPSFGLICSLHFPYEPLKIFIVRVFYITSYLVFAVWMGCGLYLLSGFIRDRRNRIGAQLSNAALSRAVSIIFLVLPIIPLIANFHENDRSNYYIAYDHGLNLLNSAKKNAIILAHGDNDAFVLAYFKYVENARPDITLYDRLGVFKTNIYGTELLQASRKRQKKVRTVVENALVRRSKRPVYYSTEPEIEGITSKQVGILYRAYPEGSQMEEEEDPVPKYRLRGEDDPSVYKDFWTRNLVFVPYHYELGIYYAERKEYEKAAHHFRKAADNAVKNRHVYLFNLSKAFMDMRKNDEAVEALKECIEEKADYHMAYLRLGNIYLASDRLDDAESAYRSAMEAEADYERAYYNLGVIADKRGDKRKAEKLYKKALFLNDTFDLPYFALGALYMEQLHDYEKAEHYLNGYLEISPDGALAQRVNNALDKIAKMKGEE